MSFSRGVHHDYDVDDDTSSQTSSNDTSLSTASSFWEHYTFKWQPVYGVKAKNRFDQHLCQIKANSAATDLRCCICSAFCAFCSLRVKLLGVCSFRSTTLFGRQLPALTCSLSYTKGHQSEYLTAVVRHDDVNFSALLPGKTAESCLIQGQMSKNRLAAFRSNPHTRAKNG